MGAKLTGAELNAAHPHGADQENPAPSLGLAPRRQEPCLLSQVRRIVLAEGGAACARARDDLRREWRLRMERTQDWLGRRLYRLARNAPLRFTSPTKAEA